MSVTLERDSVTDQRDKSSGGRLVAGRGEVKAAILKLLEDSPSGKSARQVALAIGKCRDQMLTRLAELAQQGKVVSVTVPSTGRSAQVWFHKIHEAEAVKAGPLGWGGMKAKRARTVAQALAPKTTLRDDGAKIIVAEPFVDRRFVPDRVEPFFSAMAPGSYLRTGSAVERAYAERDARARVCSGAA